MILMLIIDEILLCLRYVIDIIPVDLENNRQLNLRDLDLYFEQAFNTSFLYKIIIYLSGRGHVCNT